MRLIDADDFRRILREIQTDAEHFDNEQRRNDIGSIMALLDKQPTAFDTEKVVEQLEEIKDNACDGISCVECKYTRWCNEGEKAENVAIDKAIDIVKKGGVE